VAQPTLTGHVRPQTQETPRRPRRRWTAGRVERVAWRTFLYLCAFAALSAWVQGLPPEVAPGVFQAAVLCAGFLACSARR
jgi:hypothetical protein